MSDMIQIVTTTPRSSDGHEDCSASWSISDWLPAFRSAGRFPASIDGREP